MTRRAPRVLHVGKYYPPAPGGMEKVVQLLCESERRLEHVDSRVLVANTSATTVHEVLHDVPVTRVAAYGAIGSVGVCPAFPLALARAQRDVTVIHEPNPMALVADCLAREHGPLVVWFHSEVLRPQWKYRLLYQPFLARVLRRAARIVVSSPALAEHAAELQPFRDKVVVVPFGIDAERLTCTPEVTARVEALQRESPGPRLLFVGRLVPYKGVDVLLQAMTALDATAWIVGDGPLRASLKRQAEDHGLGGERVQFLGAVTDVEVTARLHACDVFVLPSVTHAETFGMVQLEAMACGVPVVSTNVRSGVPWVNRHGETGLVVEPGNAEALAAALAQLIADPLLRRRMGEAGRARVAREFTLAAMAARTAALYRTVTCDRGGMARDLVARAVSGRHAAWPDDPAAPRAAEVLQSAIAQGVDVLLAARPGSLAGWPLPLREQLYARATSGLAIESVRERELERVLSSLAAAGLPALVAKGAAFAYSIYPQPHLRPRVDTDLLVRRDDVPRVIAALTGLGYERAAQNVGELVSHQVALGRVDRHGVWHAVDVHWKIANPQVFADLLTVPELLAAAVPVPALGPAARMPRADHALLLAVIHAAAHHTRRPRLIWLYDLHLLWSRMSAEDMDRAVAVARARGLAVLCARALRESERTFDTQIAAWVFEALEAVDPRTEVPARYVEASGGKLDTLLSDLRSLRSWQARGRLIREHVFPPAEYMLRVYRTSRRSWLPALYAHRAITGGWRWIRQE
jgi:glycosyltransferase involved in cell wall biosynthesis